ncbi:50S ribosomal protein L5 [Candidatus Peribacteria bacterium]|nr:MAG: 50S ribosomal protein L5 [Candidatus Peribacteria bacterium]
MAYATLHDRLRGPIADALKKELGITNVHALPKIKQVVVNVGINRTKMEGKEMQELIEEALMKMTGQKPVFRESKKSISNFKITKGRIVGAMVTLRGRKMEEFLDRLISYVLPRIRDFRGLPTKLDGHGNYAIGLKDHTVFPEIPALDIQKTFGFQIQITTTAGNDEAGKALLKQIGMPFRPDRKSESGN